MNKAQKIAVGIVSMISVLAGLVGLSSQTAQASTTAYTWVNNNGNYPVWVVCHNREIMPIGVGSNSALVCPNNGWVDGLRTYDAGWHYRCTSFSTGNVIDYPKNYMGSIGGGSYGCHLTL